MKIMIFGDGAGNVKTDSSLPLAKQLELIDSARKSLEGKQKDQEEKNKAQIEKIDSAKKTSEVEKTDSVSEDVKSADVEESSEVGKAKEELPVGEKGAKPKAKKSK